MTKAELSKFQTILTAKRDDAARTTRKRDGLTIQPAPDVMDALQFASEREFTSRDLERGSKMLRDVHAALQRIAEGTYGICAECEEEISQKRLLAVPWATHCIGCQERADRHASAGFEFDEEFAKAA